MANELSSVSDANLKIRDLEDRQRLIRDKLNLLSTNFIDLKNTLEKEVTDLKISTDNIKYEIAKIKDLIVRISEELDNRAKRSELELVAKQLKIMKPLMI
jgi:septal ring factor EnvC (AmiA/AmiB activator)